MLDASASRLEYQELISCQGYVIAKSLQKCGIPVQVYSYLSIRGFTVMNRFLQYSDGISGDCRSLFRYFAAGWNRDGLALRGAGELMHSSPARNKILIILTDRKSQRRSPAFPWDHPGASHVSRIIQDRQGLTTQPEKYARFEKQESTYALYLLVRTATRLLQRTYSGMTLSASGK